MIRRLAALPRLAVAGLLIAATSVAVGATPRVAQAAGSFTQVPTRLYMIPDEHSMVVPDLLAGLVIPITEMKFTDTPTPDLISGQNREIKVTADEMASCNVVATTQPPFDLTGCTALQLGVVHGTLKFDPPPVAEDDPRFPMSNPRIQMYRFSNDVLLRDVSEPEFLEGGMLALIGKASGMDAVLKTLVYTPMVDDPMTEDIDEDYYYEDPTNAETLTIMLGPGDQSGSITRYVDIKVLDYNNFPEVTVQQDQWTIANGGGELPLFTPPDETQVPTAPTLSVADEDNDEVIDERQDDGDPNDGDLHDGDDPDDGEGDEFLVAMWTTCGKIELISTNGWGIIDDVEHVIDYAFDATQENGADPGQKDLFVNALKEVLPDEVEQFPFAVPSNPAQTPTTGFVGVVNDIEALNYSLGRVTFHAVDAANAPLSDVTCKVRVLITDLGNNGLPLHYFGDPPSGIVIPMFGVDFDTNYVPAVEELTIDVGAGDPPGEGGNAPTLTSVSDVTLAEGNAGITDFVFTLSLSEPASGDEAVLVAADHAGGADTTDDTDLTAISPQLVSFAAGASSATFTVPVSGDGDIEADEHFVVALSDPQNLSLADSSGIGTVQNDDGLPDEVVYIDQINDVTMPEGNAGTTDFVFTIGLSDPAPASGVSVRVTTSHVTTDGGDLTPLVAQPVSFAPGQTTRTVAVKVQGDTDVEPNQTFAAALSSPQGAVLLPTAQSATGTIVNDDFRHVTSVSDVLSTEGNVGPKTFTFTITLDGAAVGGEVVNYATANGTATLLDDDYESASGSLTFAAGETSKTVDVTVNGDTVPEQDQTFTLGLINPTNLVLDDASGTGTIVNDDSRTLVSIAAPSLTEGNAATKNFPFTLTLDGPAVGGESVLVSTTHLETDDTDLMPLTNQLVTFAPGMTTATVNVVVNGDTDPEDDQDFRLDVSTPTNLIIGPGAATAIGTIVNDDLRRVVAIDDVTMAEGDGPGTTPFTFTITLDGPAIGTTTAVTAFNTHGTSDNTDLALTEIVAPFAEGATTATVTFPVNGDTTPEVDDTFTVSLKDPVSITIDPATGAGNGVIQDDDDPDAPPMVSIGDVTMAEGSGGGTTNFVFTLTLDKPALGTETVDVATNHVSTDAIDLTIAPSPVVFAPGAMSATVTVAVGADSTPEPDETFTLTLSNPVGLLIGDNSATGTIQNDDDPPAAPIVSIGDVTMAEGSGGGTTPFVFTLSLDKPALGTESVEVVTNTITTNLADHGPAPNPVVFAQGAMSATVTVPVGADTDDEIDETFTLMLVNPSGLTIGDGSATGTIQNDDGAGPDPNATDPTVTIGDLSMLEGTGGTTDFVFTLTLDKPAAGTETVAVATNHVSTDASDLTAAPSPAVFAPGAMSATVTVVVGADSDVENDETFTLTLSNPVGLLIGDGSATGTIQNDDQPPAQPGDPLAISDQGDITVPNDPGKPGAVVPFPMPTSTGGVAPVTITCTNQSGAFYPLGPTTVTCTAVDSDPNQGLGLASVTDTFVITVVDTEPPVINDNPDLVRFTPGNPVVVTFPLPGASDNSGVPPVVACSPVSGTSFAVGAATVTCTATDGAGNHASSSFTVTVVTEFSELPATGGDPRLPAMLGAAALLLGFGMLTLRRRRPSVD